MSLAEISHKLQGPYSPKDFNLVGKRTKKEDLPLQICKGL